LTFLFGYHHYCTREKMKTKHLKNKTGYEHFNLKNGHLLGLLDIL
jgi:hypothetical protein